MNELDCCKPSQTPFSVRAFCEIVDLNFLQNPFHSELNLYTGLHTVQTLNIAEGAGQSLNGAQSALIALTLVAGALVQ